MARRDTPQPLTTGGRAWGPERVSLGISLRQLAVLSGVRKDVLSMAENGRLMPSGDEWAAVMAALRKVRDDRGPVEVPA